MDMQAVIMGIELITNSPLPFRSNGGTRLRSRAGGGASPQALRYPASPHPNPSNESRASFEPQGEGLKKISSPSLPRP
ncbi:hypothetical protein TomTYG75_24600 [Sphingobium sp. TomTYG75]